MKYVHLLILIIILSVTWGMTHRSENEAPADIHYDIQAELQGFIEGFIRKNLPNSNGIKFHSMFTELTNQGFIKANFEYSFDNSEMTGEEVTRSTLNGYALLKPEDPEDENSGWNLESIGINNEILEFQNGSVIRKTE